MEQTTQTFENDAFSIESTQEKGCRLNLKIVVKPVAAQKSYKKAIKTVNKQISIPGFRKGRAPDKTVISRHSSYVDQEWKEELIQAAYQAGLDLTEVYPINKESIDKPKIESCSQEEGAVVALSYEHYPTVPAVDLNTLQLKRIDAEPVSEEQVDEVIEHIRTSSADWETIEDRPIEEGDHVDISIDGIDSDPVISVVKDRRFEVADNKTAPWLKKMLLGKNAGDVVEGMSELDESASDAIKKDFEPKTMRVTIHEIYKMLLPELNDELAIKVGVESVEDLHVKIRKNLEDTAEENAQKKRIEALEEALLTAYQFDLPQSILKNEVEHRLEEKKDADKEEVEKEVEKSYRLYFLEKEIGKQGSVTTTQDEINHEAMKQLSQNPYLFRENDPEFMKQLINSISLKVLRRKVQEYALSQVQIV